MAYRDARRSSIVWQGRVLSRSDATQYPIMGAEVRTSRKSPLACQLLGEPSLGHQPGSCLRSGCLSSSEFLPPTTMDRLRASPPIDAGRWNRALASCRMLACGTFDSTKDMSPTRRAEN